MNIRTLKSFFIASLILLTSPLIAQAHIGGHGEISEVDVIPMASEHVAALIEDGVELPEIGKLDKGWRNVDPSNKKIDQKGDGYYVVSFAHPKEEKTLYLLLSLSGDLYDANFTGKFEGLKN